MMSVMTLTTAVMADESHKTTKLTFSEPVEVPGMVLGPGTYWFKLAGNDSERSVVEIWNSDRTRLITTILAIPDYRLQPTGKTVVHFEERPLGTPEAIHSWFYPGDKLRRGVCLPKVESNAIG